MFVVSLLLAAAWQQPTAAPAQAPATPRPIPVGVADTSPFRRLELPTATTLRTGSGAPGRDYWQQRVDYSIKAQLDTTTHTISGTETVRYRNRSPDSLRYVWFQVDQNIYRSGSRGDFLNPPNARFAARGFDGGYTISSLSAVRGAESGHGDTPMKKVPLATTEDGTMLRADLDQGLAPGGTVTFEIAFKFQVPEHGSDRMGRQQYGGHWLYEIAEWYPRVAVYDDVRGWNTEQYLGQGEFYLEYGDIDFALTVPRNFVVAGSGTLTNPLEVLTPAQRSRLAQAVKSDSTVAIIGRGEAGTAATRPAGASGTLTWKFSAKNVRDVAWAAAPNFVWDASGWKGILMQSFYPPQADTGWARSDVYVRHTIKHYSEKWFQYPYPTAINVAGPVGGMEYPMIVFCGSGAGGRGLFGVTTHELGHQWFPMIVGSNERLFAWMDEGFNTFINIYSGLAFYHDSMPRARTMDQFGQYAKMGIDVPSMLPADRVPGMLLGQAAYNKPALGLYLLRHDILADSTRFDAAFREYIRRWAFKHPTPSDFFRSMEDGLGEDLSWFWRGWFFRSDVIDLAVDSVKMRADSTGRTAWVYLSSPGQLPMPVDLRFTYADSSSETVRLPVEVWFVGNRHLYVRDVKADVTKVEVDPDHAIPDVRRENNVWAK